jgi:hypothetical protein
MSAETIKQTVEVKDEGNDFSRVERIAESRGYTPMLVAELDEIVETPLLEAAKQLYLKGVRTLESGANPNQNIELGFAFLTIEYDSLSEENKRVVDRLIVENDRNKYVVDVSQGGDGVGVGIKIPFGKDVTVREIADAAVDLAEQFKKQPMTWAPRYSLQDIKDMYLLESDEDAIAAAEFDELILGPDGNYYNNEEQMRLAFGEDA